MGIYKEIEERLSIFIGLYDTFRVVNPIDKYVIEEKDGKLCNTCKSCFTEFQRKSICTNCISMRALLNAEACIKVKQKNGVFQFGLAVPIKYEGRYYIVEFLKKYQSDDMAIELLKSKQNLIDQINILSDKLLKDEMTNIYNKRFIKERLPVELRYAKRHNFEVYAIMCDIDFFKKVNDTYGHLIGDAVLIFFANELKTAFQMENDWVARYGGEEFLIYLQHYSQEEVTEKVQNIIDTFHKKHFVQGEIEIPITASFGIRKWQGESVEDFIKNADDKLYQAKQNGRDCYFI